jgi:tetratricopeptide (TPR) repeat protein
MNHKIVAVCAAALVISGCDERSATPSAPSPPATAAVRTPATAPPARAPEPIGAGVEIPEAEGGQILALAHEESRQVDHLSRATALREQGDFEGAVAEARRALFDEPEDVEALEEIARAARLAGLHEIRLEALERLAALRPEDPAPLVRRARALLSLKRFAEALAAGMLAVERGPEEPEAYQARGRAQLSKGELAPAIADFEKVLALKPDHGHALNNLGFAYLRANRNHDAVEVLRRAVEALPHVAYVHNNLGVALERVGRIDEAKEAYAAASFLSPKYVKAQVNASRIARLARASAADGGSPQAAPATPLEAASKSEE